LLGGINGLFEAEQVAAALGLVEARFEATAEAAARDADLDLGPLEEGLDGWLDARIVGGDFDGRLLRHGRAGVGGLRLGRLSRGAPPTG
jgi:hypothetical protein